MIFIDIYQEQKLGVWRSTKRLGRKKRNMTLEGKLKPLNGFIIIKWTAKKEKKKNRNPRGLPTYLVVCTYKVNVYNQFRFSAEVANSGLLSNGGYT